MSASPRTVAEPMAFTRAEFWRGALSAWFWFFGLSTAVWTLVVGPYVMIALIFLVPWSVGAVVVFSGPAFVLGRRMRRVRAQMVHLVAFSSLGLVIGGATTWLWSVVTDFADVVPGFILLVNVAASILAVSLGWWTARRSALRTDAREAAADRDQGGAAEDALADIGSGVEESLRRPDAE